MTEIAELEKIEYALVKLKYKYAKELDAHSKFADAILDFWNLDQGPDAHPVMACTKELYMPDTPLKQPRITCICGVSFRPDDARMVEFHKDCHKQRFIHDRKAALSEIERMPDYKNYLRQLLIGLECQNIEKLLSDKQDPLIFRYLGERIACSAKAGAALGIGIAPEEK